MVRIKRVTPTRSVDSPIHSEFQVEFRKAIKPFRRGGSNPSLTAYIPQLMRDFFMVRIRRVTPTMSGDSPIHSKFQEEFSMAIKPFRRGGSNPSLTAYIPLSMPS